MFTQLGYDKHEVHTPKVTPGIDSDTMQPIRRPEEDRSYLFAKESVYGGSPPDLPRLYQLIGETPPPASALQLPGTAPSPSGGGGMSSSSKQNVRLESAQISLSALKSTLVRESPEEGVTSDRRTAARASVQGGWVTQQAAGPLSVGSLVLIAAPATVTLLLGTFLGYAYSRVRRRHSSSRSSSGPRRRRIAGLASPPHTPCTPVPSAQGLQGDGPGGVRSIFIGSIGANGSGSLPSASSGSWSGSGLGFGRRKRRNSTPHAVGSAVALDDDAAAATPREAVTPSGVMTHRHQERKRRSWFGLRRD